MKEEVISRLLIDSNGYLSIRLTAHASRQHSFIQTSVMSLHIQQKQNDSSLTSNPAVFSATDSIIPEHSNPGTTGGLGGLSIVP